MIKINLLSPLDKDNLKWEKINNAMLKAGFWFLLAEGFFAAALFFSLEYLKIEGAPVEAKLASIKVQKETKELSEIDSSLASYKSKIENIYSIQKGHLKWTFLMENITGMVPDGVRLESISAKEDIPQDAANKGRVSAKEAKEVKTPSGFKIEITGNAKTRDDLLKLEDNLKKNELFSGLEYDEANYVESVNVNFTYIFYVSREKLLI